MTLTSKLVVSLDSTLTSALDLAQGSVPLRLREVLALADGTGAGRADKIFSDRRTLAASGTESLDLAGGLTDAFGNVITFARIKALLIVAATGNTNNVVVGGAASNGFATPFGDATDKLVLRPGGLCLLTTGPADATAYAVTAATGDLLQVANSGSGTGVTYDIVLIGASA
ncbi:hypothetical protein ACGFIV_00965 [Sphaerisporangium sp. NPDC049003]|uniref:hypothetical protein n=1 Tax=Sphaerisporangium sp. NPDC049003 TaxID=3364517 RepID=UPI0037134715